MVEGLNLKCKERSTECHYKCCTFTDNYIVLYPGEYEESMLKKEHLKIIDDYYYGGKKVICIKRCTSGDFKPLDCKSYPFFPFFDSDGNLRLIKGRKCPLEFGDLVEHKQWVLKEWGGLLKNSKIREWVKKIKLVGYEPLDEK